MKDSHDFNKKGIDIVDKISIFLIIFGVITLNRGSSLSGGDYFWLSIVIFLVVVSIYKIMNRNNLYFGFYGINQFFFLLIVFSSTRWAVSPDLAMAGFNSVILTTIIMFSLVNIIDNIDKCWYFINAMSWAGLVMILYFGITSGFTTIFNIRVAQQSEMISNINANSIGMSSAISAISSVIYGIKFKSKSTIYNLLAIFLIVFSLFTGSRKVIIILIVCLGVIYIFVSKNKRFIRIYLALISVILFIYSILNVPFLYNIMGYRLEGALGIVTEGKTDMSTEIRMRMAETGVELFKEKPILGYGIANAEIYNEGTYLHNNYLELLVGIGIVGMCIYYLNPILGLKRNLKQFKNDNNILSLYFLSILGCLFLLDFSFVSYNNRLFQIIIAISIRYTSILNSVNTLNRFNS